jgi:hypothetical protein
MCVSFGVFKKRVDGFDRRLENIGAQLRAVTTTRGVAWRGVA